MTPDSADELVADDDGSTCSSINGEHLVSPHGSLFTLRGPIQGHLIALECISVAEPRSIYAVELVVVDALAQPPSIEALYDKAALVLPAERATSDTDSFLPPLAAELLQWASDAVCDSRFKDPVAPLAISRALLIPSSRWQVSAGAEVVLFGIEDVIVEKLLAEIEEEHAHVFLPMPVALLPLSDARALRGVTWIDLTFPTDPKTHPVAALRRVLKKSPATRMREEETSLAALCTRLARCFLDSTAAALDLVDWEALSARAEHCFVPPLHSVCTQGEVDSCAFVVAAGDVSLEFRGPDGAALERMSRDLVIGQYFGEVALLGPCARTFSAEATKHGVDLLILRHADYAQLRADRRLQRTVELLRQPASARSPAGVRSLLVLIDELAAAGALPDGRATEGFLTAFSVEERLGFARRLQVHELMQGQEICRRGEEADSLYFVLQGCVAPASRERVEGAAAAETEAEAKAKEDQGGQRRTDIENRCEQLSIEASPRSLHISPGRSSTSRARRGRRRREEQEQFDGDASAWGVPSPKNQQSGSSKAQGFWALVKSSSRTALMEGNVRRSLFQEATSRAEQDAHALGPLGAGSLWDTEALFGQGMGVWRSWTMMVQSERAIVLSLAREDFLAVASDGSADPGARAVICARLLAANALERALLAGSASHFSWMRYQPGAVIAVQGRPCASLAHPADVRERVRAEPHLDFIAAGAARVVRRVQLLPRPIAEDGRRPATVGGSTRESRTRDSVLQDLCAGDCLSGGETLAGTSTWRCSVVALSHVEVVSIELSAFRALASPARQTILCREARAHCLLRAKGLRAAARILAQAGETPTPAEFVEIAALRRDAVSLGEDETKPALSPPRQQEAVFRPSRPATAPQNCAALRKAAGEVRGNHFPRSSKDLLPKTQRESPATRRRVIQLAQPSLRRQRPPIAHGAHARQDDHELRGGAWVNQRLKDTVYKGNVYLPKEGSARGAIAALVPCKIAHGKITTLPEITLDELLFAQVRQQLEDSRAPRSPASPRARIASPSGAGSDQRE